MAERRMFAKSVVGSDVFTNMPFSAQSVYFHLAMQADDDGFLGNARGILRLLGGGEEELQLLADKGYIRLFDSGVVAIVHWKVNNYIQKDRYKPSVYRKEKALMYPTSEEKSEAEDASVSNLDTQVRIGKDSIGKDSTGKDSTGKDRIDKDRTDKDNSGKDSTYKESTGEKGFERSAPDGVCEKIFDLYNSICTSLPQVRGLTQSRKECISLLLKKYTRDQITEVFRKAQSCDFLCGMGKNGWKANFDWLIREDNFLRVQEGAYDSEPRGEPCSYDLEAYEKYSMFDD